MNVLKIGAIILGLALIVTCGFIVIQQISNADLKQELSTTKNDLLKNSNQLTEIEEKLNISESFTKTFMKAYGAYEVAWLTDRLSISLWNTALSYYANDSWDNAIKYYGEASNSYMNASHDLSIVASMWNNAKNYTENATYLRYCDLKYNAHMADSKSEEHYSSAMDYLRIACQYYKNNDYTTGGNNFDKYLIEIDRASEDSATGTNYRDESDMLLKEFFLANSI